MMYPSEVVVGAALVALALPGGDRVLRWQKVDVSAELSEAPLNRPDRALVSSALDALRAVADPQREWMRSWVADDDRSVSGVAAARGPGARPAAREG